MSRDRIDLDRIAVASPCPMSWNDMVGDDRVRFCNQCNLNVYNISAMTKLEAESFITNVEGRICAKLYRRADGTILTRDCPIGLRAVRKKISRAAAAAFSALISLFGGSALFAQQPKNETRVDIQRTLRRYGQAAIEGTVFDLTHTAIPGAQVKLINERTKQEVTTKANDNGRFRFSDLEMGIYTIQIYREGFVKLEQLGVEVSDEQALKLDVTLKIGEVLGLLVADPPSPIPINDTIPSGELKRKDRPRE
jgi:Carboxypeptidase regulatory-like domain